MIFVETSIPGAWLVEVEPHTDERGCFGRIFGKEEFASRGLVTDVVQCALSGNWKRGTLRGLHYQAPPHEEAKLIGCVRGAIHDVLVDLRPDSPAYCRWFATELVAPSAGRGAPRRLLYVPPLVAHGYQTLAEESEVFYQLSALYDPACARGVRWNDPAFGIEWPPAERVLCERDRTWPDFMPRPGGPAA